MGEEKHQKHRLQSVFRSHQNEKPTFSNSCGLKNVFDKHLFRDGLVWTGRLNRRSKGTGKRGHIVEDTLLPTQMFPRLPARATFVADLCPGHKNASGCVQKLFVSATNVSQFAQPKKHHEQLCVRNNVSSFASTLKVRFQVVPVQCGPGLSPWHWESVISSVLSFWQQRFLSTHDFSYRHCGCVQGSYPFSETNFQDFSRIFPGLRLIF